MKLLTGSFEERLRESISVAWQIFMEKVGGGQLSINKEASIELRYVFILQQVVSLICFHKDETVKIELETDAQVPNKNCEIDLVLEGEKSQRHYKIAVERKYYQEKHEAENDFSNLLTGSFEERLRESISFAWQIFMEKVGGGQLSINKEASMQLHYACVLQQVVPLIYFRKDETAKIELETGVTIHEDSREIDLVLDGENSQGHYKIAVEMKCHRKKRGGENNFMEGVYEDLIRLEEYCKHAKFKRGVALVMNEKKRLVKPKRKKGKRWCYDISDGATIRGTQESPNSNEEEPVDSQFKKSYEFTWNPKGNFWFLELEGQ